MLILFIFLVNFFEFEALFGYKSEYFWVLRDLIFDVDLFFYGFGIFVLIVIEIIVTSILLIFDIFDIDLAVAFELIVWFVIDDVDIDFFSGFLLN